MTYKERFNEFLECKKTSMNKVSKEIGVAYSALYKSVNNNNPTKLLLLLLEKYYKLNTEWLINGKGVMFLEDEKTESVLDPRMEILKDIFNKLSESGKYRLLSVAYEESEKASKG